MAPTWRESKRFTPGGSRDFRGGGPGGFGSAPILLWPVKWSAEPWACEAKGVWLNSYPSLRPPRPIYQVSFDTDYMPGTLVS